MIVQETSIVTDHPGRMILKLCKHFRHKVPVEFNEHVGRVDFQPGRCVFTADEQRLKIRIEGQDDAEIGRMHYVLEDHIQRFTRSQALTLAWQTLPGSASPDAD
jgi:hypothetical protein